MIDTITIERAATAIPVKPRLKFGLKRLALACLAVAATLGGITYGRYWWTLGRFIECTDDAYAGGNVTPVAPHVAGFIAQILVTDNQYVRAGQILIRLDARVSRQPSITLGQLPISDRRRLPRSRRNSCCSRR